MTQKPWQGKQSTSNTLSLSALTCNVHPTADSGALWLAGLHGEGAAKQLIEQCALAAALTACDGDDGVVRSLAHRRCLPPPLTAHGEEVAGAAGGSLRRHGGAIHGRCCSCCISAVDTSKAGARHQPCMCCSTAAAAQGQEGGQGPLHAYWVSGVCAQRSTICCCSERTNPSLTAITRGIATTSGEAAKHVKRARIIASSKHNSQLRSLSAYSWSSHRHLP